MAEGEDTKYSVEEISLAAENLQTAHDALEGLEDDETQKIKRSVQKTIALLNRITQSPCEIQISEINLQSAIHQVLQMIAPLCEGVEINIEVDQSTRIHTSELDLLRILGNLIKNAATALATHKRDKKITISSTQNEDGETVITVSDTGPGLPEEVAINPFCEKQRAKRGKDHGFGLPSVKTTTTMLGGKIVVEKTDSEGAMFKLTLPTKTTGPIHYSLPENAEAAHLEIRRIIHDVRNGLSSAFSYARQRSGTSKEASEFITHLETAEFILSMVSTSKDKTPAEKISKREREKWNEALNELLKGKNILIIDDEKDVLEGASELLKDRGLKLLTITLCADTLRESLDRIPGEELPNTVVIADQNMPKITGFQLARELKARYPQVKTVLHTGSNPEAQLKKAEDNPFDDSLTKPDKIITLLELMQRLFPEG